MQFLCDITFRCHSYCLKCIAVIGETGRMVIGSFISGRLHCVLYAKVVRSWSSYHLAKHQWLQKNCAIEYSGQL